MADVFLSYAKEDEELVAKFAKLLESEGFDVWWDKHLIPDRDLNDIISRELQECKVAIVIWSAAACKSDWVIGEATTAQQAQKLISTHVPEFGHDLIPIRFRGLPTVSTSSLDSITSAIIRFNVRPSQYDQRIKELLVEATEKNVFGDSAVTPSDAATEWNDQRHFAKCVVRLAIRDLDFPIETELASFTDGINDLGIDGFAVAVGTNALITPEQAAECVAQNPNASLRVLFVQAKLTQIVHERDVGYFGSKVQQILTLSEGQLIKSRPNELILNQWRCLDAARRAFASTGKPVPLDVSAVFIYAGQWQNYFKPSAQLEQITTTLRMVLPEARLSCEIWGVDEIASAISRAGLSIQRKLKDVALIELPSHTKAKGYIGHVKSSSLIECFSRSYKGNIELDPRFFIENPRSFLGSNDRKGNPGAFGLQATVRSGQGENVVYGHNGVVIVARSLSRDAENEVTLIAPQVVNGCQSCYALSEARDKLEGVSVPVRIIVTEDESLEDDVIRASNTQAAIVEADLLSRLPGLRSLCRPFEVGRPDAPDRLWLQRRRNEWIESNFRGWQRVLTPRQLFEAYFAAIEGMPHQVHSGAGMLMRRALEGEVFTADHEPTMYRALGWLVVSGRRWAERKKDKKWVDHDIGGFVPGGARNYAARHQFVYALMLIADEASGEVPVEQRLLGRASQDRFQRLIDRVVRDEVGSTGARFTDLADQAVQAACEQGNLTGDLVTRAAFTLKVKEAALRLRP